MSTRIALALGCSLGLAGSLLAATLEIGGKAPAFPEMTWVQGTAIDPSAAGARKATVVEFWATWCGPCIASIPHLNELATAYADKGVAVVGVTSADESNTLEAVQRFVTEQGAKMSYRIAFDADRETYAAYMDASGQQGIPTAFVIDAGGNVAWIGHPMNGLDEVVAEVSAGTFDLAKAKAAANQEAELQAVFASRDRTKILAKLDELIAKEPSTAIHRVRKLAFVAESEARHAEITGAAGALAGEDLAFFTREAVNLGIAADLAPLSKPLSNSKDGALTFLSTAVWIASGSADEAKVAIAGAREAIKTAPADVLEEAVTVLAQVAGQSEAARQEMAATLALELLDHLVVVDPTSRDLAWQRYSLLSERSDERAASAGQRVLELAGNDPVELNAVAWTLLTEPPYAGFANALALEAARRLEKNLLGDKTDALYLDTVALAEFENGQIPRAIELQERALGKLSKDQDRFRPELEERLARYKAAAGK